MRDRPQTTNLHDRLKKTKLTDTRLDEAERYLASLELFGMRFGLDRMQRLMTALDSPQERFRSIHVVGTNGKSSTTRMIAAILRHHGTRVGAYTSPHLASFAERIEVDGQLCTPGRFAASVLEAAAAARLVNRTLGSGDCVTQFEALTAAAYLELAQAGIEVATIEAGLGGRFDATSVIDSTVQVLTNVGLEHTRWLGPTERHIAEEKLAVVPNGGTLVTGPLGAEAARVADTVASERGVELVRAGHEFRLGGNAGRRFTVATSRAAYDEIELAPLGDFQRANFAVAVAAAEAFRGSLRREAVRAAARDLALPGRLDVVGRHPLVIIDGAHNPSGIDAVCGSLDELIEGRPLTALVSILDDKDAAGMLARLLPLCTRVVYTRANHPRALPPPTLESLGRQLGGPLSVIESEPATALAGAVEQAGEAGAILVIGSIFLLSELVRGGTLAELGEC